MTDPSAAAAAAATAATADAPGAEGGSDEVANRRRTTSFVDPALAESISKDAEWDPLAGAMHGMNVKGEF